MLDLSEHTLLHAGVSRATDRSSGSEMLKQFLLRQSAGLDEQASVDRLVRHLVVRLFRKLRFSHPAICLGDQFS